MSSPASTVAILGSGSIGVSWAIVFARAGHDVRLYDIAIDRLGTATAELSDKVRGLGDEGLLHEPVDVIISRVHTTSVLSHAVRGCVHIQECAPEILELKQDLFDVVESHATPGAVIASSSSAIPASLTFGSLETRGRCMVAHPANPPHILPIVELVPAPFTELDVVHQTHRLLRDAGMSPVILRREIEGFVYNRLQGAVLREAWCLVRDGVISVSDLDQVMTQGLGRRWSVVGPFETSDLNTRGGIEAHAVRMGPAYHRMGLDRGQDDPWTPDLISQVVSERRDALPLMDWDRRVRWRDHMLLMLQKARIDANMEGHK